MRAISTSPAADMNDASLAASRSFAIYERMALTTRQFASVMLAASVAVLGTALLSQYWGGLAPCELCLLQRWPWRIAIVLAAAVWLAGDRGALTWGGMGF